MKKSLIYLFFTTHCFIAFCQVDEGSRQMVFDFVACVKSRNADKLAHFIQYPLIREAPLPAIKNEQEFVARYREIFDEDLIQLIVTASIAEDWSSVGWRGIMLKEGELWLNDAGKVYGINHQSAAERARKEALISAGKQSLHPSLANFMRPVYVLKTAKFRIRIDELADGKFRYASWPLAAAVEAKPDLVLTNGVYIPQGSGGNHTYEFTNGAYTYSCFIEIVGAGKSEGQLTVTKGDNVLLEQELKIIRN